MIQTTPSNVPTYQDDDRGAPPRWSRFLAAMLDLPCMMVVAAAINVVTGWAESDPLFGPVVVLLISTFAYHLLLEASPLQATLGKKLLGMRSVEADGKRLPWWKAAARAYLRLGGWMTFGLPHAIAAFTPSGAMLHDALTGTRTVKADGAGDRPASSSVSGTLGVRWRRAGAITAGACITLVLAAFTYLMTTTQIIRNNVSLGYADVRPTLDAIDEFQRTHRRFPKSLDEIGGKPTPGTPYLESVSYAPEAGSLILQFSIASGARGIMFIAPMKGLHRSDPHKIEWICGGSSGFLPSFLPRECLTIGELAMRQIRAAAQAAAK